MERFASRWLYLWAFLILGGCDGGGENGVNLGTKPAPQPVVTALPAPGSYRAFEMTVTVTTTANATLFYDLARTPDPKTNQGFKGQFSIRLQKNSRINVIVQDGDRTWGPYVFEYQLSRPLPGGGACAVAPFSRYWYRGIEPVSASIDYQLPLSISQLDVLIDGQATPLTLSNEAGSTVADLGTLSHGVHEIGCRIRSLDLADITGDSVTLAVDSQAPVAAWLDSGGTFSHETWPAVFRLQTSDDDSGVAAVKVCNGAQTHCMPMLPLAGDTYAYATVLTAQTNATANLAAVVTDLAGNSTLVGTLPIDLSAFAEPPLPGVTPITLTTDPVLDLPQYLSRTVAEVCFLDPSLPCPGDPANIALTAGWNDFLFRAPGRTDWESFAIYRLGIKVVLPPSSAPWLVFAAETTAPLMQARLIDVTTGSDLWQRSWFDVPHVFFVKDLSVPPNARWDAHDQVFILPTDTFEDSLLARQQPVAAAAVLLPLSSTAVTQLVTLSCPADCAMPGNLYFERRATYYGYPLTHAALPATFNTPITIAAEADEACLFFWDENDDGAANGREPRSIQPCSTADVVLRHQDGPLRWFHPIVMGVPFGGAVTRSMDILSSGGDPLVTLRSAAVSDVDGNGQLRTALAEGPLPGVQTRFRFAIGAEVTSVTFGGGAPFSSAHSYQVDVTDENGFTLEALVQLQQGAFTNAVITDVFGHASIDALVAPGTPPYPQMFAMRNGYLSVATAATSDTVTLRLLSDAATGVISGVVLDVNGQPVSNASITWDAPPYRSQTLSAFDGSYALPASGGAGILTASATGTYARTVAFALDITAGTVGQLVIMPADQGTVWPQGILSLTPAITGADLIDTYLGGQYYAAAVSGNGTLQANWDGINRTIVLPGALPATLSIPGDYYSAPVTTFLSSLQSRAVCGAYSQAVLTEAFLGNSCWNWVGDDGIQEYYFARLTPANGFPPLFGMGQLSATVHVEGPLPDPELVFHDMLLGRSVRLMLVDGQVTGLLPMGIYRIQTADGRWLLNNGDETAEISIHDYYSAPVVLILAAE